MCISLPFHVCLSLSLFMSVSLSLFTCLPVVVGTCVVVCRNASVCTFKTLPCVHSRHPVSHVINTRRSLSLVCLSSRVSLSLLFSSLSSHTFLSRYLCSSFSVSCQLSPILFSITITTMDRPVGFLSLIHTALSCPEGQGACVGLGPFLVL